MIKLPQKQTLCRQIGKVLYEGTPFGAKKEPELGTQKLLSKSYGINMTPF
jgi:hypothetical protein